MTETPKTNTVANFEIIESENKYEKMSVKDILSKSKKIKPQVIAKEVLGWLISNVENYIDNQVRIFKLDLVIDSSESMQETLKLQNLYRAIPDDDAKSKQDEKELQDCRTVLNDITDQAYKKIVENEKGLQELFKRLVFYYEMTGFRDGKPLIRELDGVVNISKFEYEAFSVGVKILTRKDPISPKNATPISDLPDKKKAVMKQYVIPEGFTVWLEIAFKTSARPTSMF
jgi:hypothetical protein